MGRRFILHLTMTLLSGSLLQAQEYLNKDSLLAELGNLPEDTIKVKLLISIGQQYEGNQPDSAIWYYKKALQVSKKLNYTRGVISYYTNVTYVYNLLGKYDTSLMLNLQGLEVAMAYGAIDRIIPCLNNVAVSYYYLGDYEKSIEYYLKTLELLKKNRDEGKLATLYSNLAGLFLDTKEYAKANNYCDSALYLSRKSGNIYYILLALNAKARALTNLFLYHEAIDALKEGISMNKRVNDNYMLNSFILNLGDVYLKMGKTNEVEPLYREALRLSESLNDKKSICISYRGLGYYYLNKKVYTEAEKYTRLSVKVADENGMPGEAVKSYLLLSDLALAKGALNEYNYLRKISDSIADVVLNEDILKNIHDLEIKYSALEKERDIESLHQASKLQQLEIRKKQLMLLSLLGVLFTTALTFFFILRGNRQKRRILEQEKEIQDRRIVELEFEKQLISSEAILKGQEEERKRLARDLHDGLGGMLSGIKFSFSQIKENLIMTPENQNAFDRSLEMLGSSIQELRQIAHNMMPDTLLKFGLDTALRDFCADYNQSGAINIAYQAYNLDKMSAPQSTVITVYRIVQELLTNVRKHAAASEAMVQLVYSDSTLTITVEDNGKGFDTGMLDNAAGIGWKNIKSRVGYLNGTFDVKSEEGKGTAVNIVLRLKD